MSNALVRAAEWKQRVKEKENRHHRRFRCWLGRVREKRLSENSGTNVNISYVNKTFPSLLTSSKYPD
jgi:hypothetical protein